MCGSNGGECEPWVATVFTLDVSLTIPSNPHSIPCRKDYKLKIVRIWSKRWPDYREIDFCIASTFLYIAKESNEVPATMALLAHNNAAYICLNHNGNQQG